MADLPQCIFFSILATVKVTRPVSVTVAGIGIEEVKRIVSFRDLEVYRNTYEAMLIVLKEIVPKLPDSEKYDLKDQLSRACKSIPRSKAEGYAKRHQKAGFQKYIDDAMGECNEVVVSLSHCRDIYPTYVSVIRCDELIDIYDKSGRQLYKLGNSWSMFKARRT